MSEHHIRLETPRLPEPGQTHFHGEQGGLGVGGLPQRLLGLGSVHIENDIQQRLLENVSDRRGAAIQSIGKHRLGLEQLPGHAGVLTALAGEQPRRLGRVVRLPTPQTGCGAIVRDGAQQLDGRFPRVDDQRGAVLQVRPSHARGEAQVGQGGLRVCVQPGAVLIGELRQRSGRTRRERQNAELPTSGGGGRLDRLPRHDRSFLEDHMRIGSGESKRADARDTGPPIAAPRPGLPDDLHRKPVPGNVRRRVLKIAVLRQQLVLERQDDLDDTRDTRGRLQVPDVRLRRSDQQWIVGFPADAVRRTRGLRLDRIAQRRAGTVRLQISDLAGRDTRALERIGDNTLLSNAIGYRQPARCAVLVNRTAANNGPDPVAVTDRILKALDDDDTGTLAAHVAVRSRVEGLALAVGREHMGVREGDHGGRRQQHIGATCQREIALPQLKCLARLVNCYQRRTARSVDGNGGTLQSQAVADPAGRGGVGGADGHIGLDLRERQFVGRHPQVIMSGQADEYAAISLRQIRWGNAGMLHRAPRRLQQKSVLRVHQSDLARRHTEEGRVKSRHIFDEARAPGHDFSGSTGFRVEELLGVPPIGGHLGYRIAAFPQHIPEFFRVCGPGKTRCITDDGKAWG
ncbi:Uncharacterised protein [Mycobacteroides abscessus subsp. abscessus]|nr:Uncharacterised protein [Mycobacteroides abscessus subsp. abscessus]